MTPCPQCYPTTCSSRCLNCLQTSPARHHQNTVVSFQAVLFLHGLEVGTQRSACTGQCTRTPAALPGICFNCWGTIASGSAVPRAARPTSDHPHHLSLFLSRVLPAARLVLTAIPRLQPSHCLKLLLFKSSHERFNSPSQVLAISNSNT